MAAFIYDDNGGPAWYSGSGTINQNDSVAIDLQRYEGGPCLGCTYTPPQANNIGKQLVLTFDVTGSTATATLDGTASHIERFNFKLGEQANQLLGSWIIANIPQQLNVGLGASDYIACKGINDQGGANCVGAYTTGGTGFIAPLQDGSYIGIIRVSEAKIIAYRFFFFGLNHIRGYSVITDANTSPEEIYSALGKSDAILMYGFRDQPVNAITSTRVQSAQTKIITVDPEIFNKVEALSSLIENE